MSKTFKPNTLGRAVATLIARAEPAPTGHRNRMEVRLYGPNGNCKEFVADPASAISVAFFALVGAPTKRAELLQELARLDYAFGANEQAEMYELQPGESIPEPWTPTPEHIAALRQPVREYIKSLQDALACPG